MVFRKLFSVGFVSSVVNVRDQKENAQPTYDAHHFQDPGLCSRPSRWLFDRCRNRYASSKMLVAAGLLHHAGAGLEEVVELRAARRRGRGPTTMRPGRLRRTSPTPAGPTIFQRTSGEMPCTSAPGVCLKHIAVLELDANRHAIANRAPEGRVAFEHRLAMAIQVPDLDERRGAELDADGAFLERIALLAEGGRRQRCRNDEQKAL